MNTKHTPGKLELSTKPTGTSDVSFFIRTPVNKVPKYLGRFYGEGILATDPGSTAEAAANAARLALCWNMHDELVAALQSFCDIQAEILSYVDRDTGTVYSDLCSNARAVLAKLSAP